MQHCDALSGPVVSAAKKSIETGNINYVLIWIPENSEEDLKKALQKTITARKLGKEAKEVADKWFYETAVRLHRAGEGEGFTGLKPEGPTDPIVEKAEKAIVKENAEDIIELMENTVENILRERFQRVLQTKSYDTDDVSAGRKYIEAYIEFVVFAHHLYEGLSKNHILDEKSKHEH